MNKDKRDCDWCNNYGEGILPGFVQYEEDGDWVICGVCEGKAEIEDTCYCHAHYSGECSCNYNGWTE